MKLIFIRHAEPDYAQDSLTQKGFREAELLARRTKNWRVTQFYCSPLGRAQATAAPTLSLHGVSLSVRFPDPAPDVICAPDCAHAIVYPWLREFEAPIDPALHPDNARTKGAKRIPWDFTPEFLRDNPILFDKERWFEAPILQNSDVKAQYEWVCGGLDGLLSRHGYERDGLCYKTCASGRASNDFMAYDGNTAEHLKQAPQDEPVIVCFCHLGVMMVMLSHLINTSPYVLLHGCFVPPASVTILSAEKRTLGHAYFRIQSMGDTSHLTSAGEPVSYYGGFAAPFQL